MSSSVHAPAGVTVPQLTAAAMGYTQPTIARHFGISDGRLRRVLSHAVARIGARSTTHAVALALMNGHLDAGQIRGRVLPAWPSVPDEERVAVLRAKFELARSVRSAITAERRRRFGALRAEGVSVKEAGLQLGVSGRTALRYEEQRLDAIARDREARDTAGGKRQVG